MKRIYILIACSLFLFSCSSGRNQFEKGNYDLAVYKAVKRLQQSPNHRKASKTLQGAYNLAVQSHLDKVAYHLDTRDAFRYDQVVKEYALINRLNNAVVKYPEYASLVKLVSVNDKFLHAKNLAANVHLEEARGLLSKGNKEFARRAVFHFNKANGYINGIVPREEFSKAMENGTERIVFLFANDRSYFKTYNSQLFYNNLINEFSNSGMRFLEILPPGMEENADQVIEIELNELVVGAESYTENMVKMVRDNVFLGHAETDSGEVLDIYGPVKARFFEYSKSVESSAIVMIQQVDPVNGSVLRREVIPSSFVWTDVWASFKGDRRALNKDQKLLVKKGEPPMPDPNWLIGQATAPLIFSGRDYLVNQLGYLM